MVNCPDLDLDRVFASLADPTRRRILRRLADRDCPVGELNAGSGISLVATLKHLSVLELAGLVETEKVGRQRQCRLRPERLRLAESWIEEAQRFWRGSLGNLRTLLEEEENHEDNS